MTTAPAGRPDPPLVQVIVATTRPQRFADKPLAWVHDRLERRDDLTLEILDLRDHPLPNFDGAVTPARRGRDYPSEEVAALGRTVDRADAFVVVTAEYNHGYPASLKNTFDYLFVEFNRKPITFVGYGNVGGARAIEQLRLVSVELEMAPVRNAIHILPELMIAAMTAEPFSLDIFAPLDQRLDLAVTDLLWWARALGAARNS